MFVRYKNILRFLPYRILLFIQYISFLIVIGIFTSCAKKAIETQKKYISLGHIAWYQPLKKSPYKDTMPTTPKPSQEIARICVNQSIFMKDKSYEVLTLENLLHVAAKKYNQTRFDNVGVWQFHYSIVHLWGKKCLILGKLDSKPQ